MFAACFSRVSLSFLVFLRRVILPCSGYDYWQFSHDGHSYFDALRFGAVWYAGDLVSDVQTQFKELRLTRAENWHNVWAHFNGRGAIYIPLDERWTNRLLVRCYGEEGYEERLSELVQMLCRGLESVLSTVLFLACFDRHCDQGNWLEIFDRWAEESAFELMWRAQKLALMMVSCDEKEVYSIYSGEWYTFCVLQPE